MQQAARSLLQQRSAQRIAEIRKEKNCREKLTAALRFHNRLTRQVSLNCDDLA